LLLAVQLPCSPAFSVDWVNVLNRFGSVIHFLETSPLIERLGQVDFTGGSGSISCSSSAVHTTSRARNNSELGSTVHEREPIQSSSALVLRKPGLARVHQIGRTVVRNVPDIALLGLLTLIATELLQREVMKQAPGLPPLLRSVANKTLVELDNKLELLSSLQWDFQPFLQQEYGNLQLQPVELFDKYVLGDVLLRVDRDLTPFLSRLLADPKQAAEISSKLKALLQVLALMGRGGERGESARRDWDLRVEELSSLLRADAVLRFLEQSTTIFNEEQIEDAGKVGKELQLLEERWRTWSRRLFKVFP
jgi:hypothetical protein